MALRKIYNFAVFFVILLFLGVSFGCATNRQIHALQKEIKQLREIAIQATKEAKANAKKYYKLSAQNAKKAEAAALRAKKAALRAESEAIKAESSAEILAIFLYEGRGGVP